MDIDGKRVYFTRGDPLRELFWASLSELITILN
jgi:hypothetical protein